MRRALDIVLCLLAAPLLLLFGALIAICVFLDSPGPVLYRSRRIGRGGRSFAMLKFRTMRHGAEGPPLSCYRDERFTPFGRALALSRLDELPQVINVLRGDMALVGPRPELEEFVESYPEAYAVILQALPGLTGPAQLRFSGEGRILAGSDDRVALYTESILPVKLGIDMDYVRTANAAPRPRAAVLDAGAARPAGRARLPRLARATRDRHGRRTPRRCSCWRRSQRCSCSRWTPSPACSAPGGALPEGAGLSPASRRASAPAWPGHRRCRPRARAPAGGRPACSRGRRSPSYRAAERPRETDGAIARARVARVPVGGPRGLGVTVARSARAGVARLRLHAGHDARRAEAVLRAQRRRLGGPRRREPPAADEPPSPSPSPSAVATAVGRFGAASPRA